MLEVRLHALRTAHHLEMAGGVFHSASPCADSTGSHLDATDRSTHYEHHPVHSGVEFRFDCPGFTSSRIRMPYSDAWVSLYDWVCIARLQASCMPASHRKVTA